jgi:hypothetical protein
MCGHLHTARYLAPRYPQRHLRRLARRIGARRSRGDPRTHHHSECRPSQSARHRLFRFLFATAASRQLHGRFPCTSCVRTDTSTRTLDRTGPHCIVGTSRMWPLFRGSMRRGGARSRIDGRSGAATRGDGPLRVIQGDASERIKSSCSVNLPMKMRLLWSSNYSEYLLLTECRVRHILCAGFWWSGQQTIARSSEQVAERRQSVMTWSRARGARANPLGFLEMRT